jgi:hypothetical protein
MRVSTHIYERQKERGEGIEREKKKNWKTKLWDLKGNMGLVFQKKMYFSQWLLNKNKRKAVFATTMTNSAQFLLVLHAIV